MSFTVYYTFHDPYILLPYSRKESFLNHRSLLLSLNLSVDSTLHHSPYRVVSVILPKQTNVLSTLLTFIVNDYNKYTFEPFY